MSGLSVLGLAVGLAMDAFAVSIAAGIMLGSATRREVFRLAFHFGLFQFLMPILGWRIGSTISEFISTWDHWAAFGLLGFIGIKMWWEALRPSEHRFRTNPTKGWMLVLLSLATSMDALAVGLSMAFLNVDVILPSVVIGVTASAFTAVGMIFGGKYLIRWGLIAEVIGGTVLIVIGLRILASHLRAG